jgi:hypothetical protein
MKLPEGGSVDDYIKKARETKNKLVSMGEPFSDRSLVQFLLNGLPRSYESTIQTLTHQGAPLTFDQVAASLVMESHRREQYTQQLGDEVALGTTFNRGSTQPPTYNQSLSFLRG